ncbi:uncharacterized protein TNCV_615481 [Trichonephila clavipes]|nr:uncharacterized protein TNCV_615481 [Trichonephila clavipes]
MNSGLFNTFRCRNRITARSSSILEFCNVNFIKSSHALPRQLDGALNNILCSSRAWVAAVAECYRYRTVACLVMSSIPLPLKTRRVGQRCTLNLSRAETSSRWCGVVVRRGDASSGVIHVT